MADVQVIIASGDIPRGLSFPSAPVAGQVFFRTDFRALYMYDGAAWDQVSVGNFAASFPGSPIDGLTVNRIDFRSQFQFVTSAGAWFQSSLGVYTGAFPASPSTNLRVYRTDSTSFYHYTGAAWAIDAVEGVFNTTNSGAPIQTIAATTSGTAVALTNSSVSFTALGSGRLSVAGLVNTSNLFGTTNTFALFLDGAIQHSSPASPVSEYSVFDSVVIAAGAHTAEIRAWGTGAGNIQPIYFNFTYTVSR